MPEEAAITCSAEKEAQLLADGWVKQFMANEPRLSEAVELYRSLGMQVHLEPVDPAACAKSSECTACFGAPELAGQFKVIFTRAAAAGPGDAGPLE